jgi:hypothetical protein
MSELDKITREVPTTILDRPVEEPETPSIDDIIKLLKKFVPMEQYDNILAGKVLSKNQKVQTATIKIIFNLIEEQIYNTFQTNNTDDKTATFNNSCKKMLLNNLRSVREQLIALKINDDNTLDYKILGTLLQSLHEKTDEQ